jgi:flagellar basal-body rod protein FlgC
MGQSMFPSISISGSGLAAERQRMELVANNIANANSTRGPNGEPYRRQHLVFASAVADGPGGANQPDHLQGVKILGVQGDDTEFPLVYNPGHPDADENGMVRMPNVQLPNEMVDLITASRSYEANLRALALFKEMIEQTLSLLRGR